MIDGPSWYLESVVGGDGNHQLAFTIELDPEYLDGQDPTVSNWFRVLLATGLYVLDRNADEFDQDEICVES